jgi:hypothetical protein
MKKSGQGRAVRHRERFLTDKLSVKGPRERVRDIQEDNIKMEVKETGLWVFSQLCYGEVWQVPVDMAPRTNGILLCTTPTAQLCISFVKTEAIFGLLLNCQFPIELVRSSSSSSCSFVFVLVVSNSPEFL